MTLQELEKIKGALLLAESALEQGGNLRTRICGNGPTVGHLLRESVVIVRREMSMNRKPVLETGAPGT